MKKIILACVLLISVIVHAADASATYDKAMALLNESQSDHSKLVPAIKLLAEAVKAFETAGDMDRATNVNSCLYWAKKRMTLADTDDLKPAVEAVKRLEVAVAPKEEKPGAIKQSKVMLETADKFARAHSGDSLSVAIQYFEVADRFPDTEEGKKAMGLSLAEMSKIKAVATAKPIEPKVVTKPKVQQPIQRPTVKTFSSNLSSVQFKDGEKCYSTRTYVVKSVPERYLGWAMLQVKPKVGINKIRFSAPSTVLFVEHEDTAVPDGFELTDETVIVCNPEPVVRKIYAKKCQADITFPPGAYLLVVESKP